VLPAPAGWLTQLIFGIAIWMFPVYSKAQPCGPEWLGWGIFSILNTGLLIRVIFEPLQGISPSNFGGWMLVLAALLQWLSGLDFVANVLMCWMTRPLASFGYSCRNCV
jgi:hypothetical protein